MPATIKDIAEQTGLGLATISSYLNGGNVREKNRIKIEAAIADLDFEVNETARGLKTNRTKNIGIVIPELNNIFCAEIITEVGDILRNHGYATMICDCRTDQKREQEAVEFLLRRRVDGLIVMPAGSEGKHLKKVVDDGKALVIIDRDVKGVDSDCVFVDNQGAAFDAVTYLLAKGHKKIGMIAGPVDIYTAKERYQGYRKALAGAGQSVIDEKLVVHGDYTISGGASAMKQLYRQNPEMTAVFVANYEMTVGAMIEINEQEIKIPQQLSFIGFDNQEFAKASNPKLSIVTQPTAEIARQVALLLLNRLGGEIEQEAKIVTLATSFIEGRSVK